MRHRRAIAVGLLVALIAYRIPVLVIALSGQIPTEDVDRFYQIAHATGRPYIDYAVEYPPVLVGVVKLLAVVAPARPSFGVAVVLLAMVSELLVAIVLRRTWGTRAALVFLVIDSFLIGPLLVRLDLLSTALSVGALAAVFRARALTAAALVTAAVGMKLWPIPVALIMLVIADPRRRRRYAVALATTSTALAGIWIALGGGLAAVQQVLSFRNAGGWQIESAVGAVVHVITHEPVAMDAGAARFGHVPLGVTVAMYGIAALVTLWVLAEVRTRTAGSAWVAAVGVFLLCAPLLSPQFMAWLVPAGALAWVAGDRRVTAGVAATVILTTLEELQYHGLFTLEPPAVALLLLRNAALLATVVAALRCVYAGRRPTSPARVQPTPAALL